jgi:hypothetical protein
MLENATRIIPMCELCRRVYDHRTDTGQTSTWTQLQAYVTHHRLHARQVAFSPAYCNDCQDGYILAATYGQR